MESFERLHCRHYYVDYIIYISRYSHYCIFYFLVQISCMRFIFIYYIDSVVKFYYDADCLVMHIAFCYADLILHYRVYSKILP